MTEVSDRWGKTVAYHRHRLRPGWWTLLTSQGSIACKIELTSRRSTVLVTVASTNMPYAISRTRGRLSALLPDHPGIVVSSQLPGFATRGDSSRPDRCSLPHETQKKKIRITNNNALEPSRCLSRCNWQFSMSKAGRNVRSKIFIDNSIDDDDGLTTR